MAHLVLIRHGESVWNKKNVFTGWVDVPLSRKGIDEALDAGRNMSHISFDVVYSSIEIRAIETAMIALAENKSDKTPVIVHPEGPMKEWSEIYSDEMIKNSTPVYTDWHLNERYYGQLQGKNKAETALLYGEELVQKWRRSYDIPPPQGESLKDTAERTIPFFENTILKELQDGKNVLISAHGNSLRSIVMFIDKLTKDEVLKLEISTGVPLFYEFENGQFLKNK